MCGGGGGGGEPMAMEQAAPAPGTQVNEVTLNEQGQPVFYNEDMSSYQRSLTPTLSL